MDWLHFDSLRAGRQVKLNMALLWWNDMKTLPRMIFSEKLWTAENSSPSIWYMMIPSYLQGVEAIGDTTAGIETSVDRQSLSREAE